MPWHMIAAKTRAARSQRGEPKNRSRISYNQREAFTRIGAYKRAQRPRHTRTQKKPTDSTASPERPKEEVLRAGRRGSEKTGFYIFICRRKGKGKRSKGKEINISQKAKKRQSKGKKGGGARYRVSAVRLHSIALTAYARGQGRSVSDRTRGGRPDAWPPAIRNRLGRAEAGKGRNL